MLSKNNYQERLRKMDDKQERFSIRKFSVGAASVLVGTAILSMQNVQTVRADATTDTANSVKTASTTSTDQTTSVNTTTFNTNQSSTAALFSASALSESKALAATPRASSATTNAQAKNNNYKLVTSSSELQQAINSGVAGINIDRSIDASNVNLAITNTFAIVGINDAAVLNSSRYYYQWCCFW